MNRLARIPLAGMLAEVARSDGWPYVKAALDPESNLVGIAVRHAAAFDGLIDANGEVIDVMAALDGLRAGGLERLTSLTRAELETARNAVIARRPRSIVR